jgi:peptidoglycan LD-endopeptidase LytH
MKLLGAILPGSVRPVKRRRVSAGFSCGVALALALAVLAGCSAARGGAAPPLPSSGPGGGRAGVAASPSPSATAVPSSSGAWHGRYVFPVVGTVSYGHTHHDYPATDIMAACGSTVRSVLDGVILEVSRTDRYDVRVDDGATRGGLFVSVLGDDGVRYYGSHLGTVVAGLGPGKRVAAGEKLGEVGHSGDASACHLHFGISPPCTHTGDWWVRRGAIWPWSYLDSWRRGGAKSPVAAVTAWQATHGCPSSIAGL